MIPFRSIPPYGLSLYLLKYLCSVCPENIELVGQHSPPKSLWTSAKIVNYRTNRNMDGAGRSQFQSQLNKQYTGHRECIEEVAYHTLSMMGVEDPTKRFGKSVRNREETRDKSTLWFTWRSSFHNA